MRIERMRRRNVKKIESTERKYFEFVTIESKAGIDAGERVLGIRQRSAKRGELAVMLNAAGVAVVRRVRKRKLGGVLGRVLYVMRAVVNE